MENKNIFKILIFVILVGYMIIELLFDIPPLINNFIYGIMAIIAIFFIFTNRKSIGIEDVFKKKKEKTTEKNK